MTAQAMLQAARTGEDLVLGSFIGGRLEDPDPDAPRIDVLDPATGRRIARIADAGEAGVARAVAAAEAAFPAWRKVPARDRGALVAELARRVAAQAYADDVTQAHHDEPQISAQLLASVNHRSFLEVFHPDRDPLFYMLVANRGRFENGLYGVPQGPGWGLELDETVIAKYRVN